MKITLKLEYVAVLILAIVGFARTEWSWWWFVGLFFAPDISMLGYLVNTKVGAFFYNLFHHWGVAILIYLGGYLFGITVLEVIGSILLGHSAFDRIVGYGLKYEDSFQNTHLGKIGKDKA